MRSRWPRRSPRRGWGASRSGRLWSSINSAMRDAVDGVYRTESRRILATLIRLLGDFDLAEEALHDAFTAAMEQWPRDGMPDNPRTWLVPAGRFKAIDRMRRRARFDASLPGPAERLAAPAPRRPQTAAVH